MDPTVESLDQETIEMIIAGGKQFQMYQEQTYVFMAGYVAWLYYHITTLDDEVAYIWPSPRLQFGKTLWLLTRYSTTFAMVVDMFSYPNYLTLSPKACMTILYMSNTLGMLARASSEGIIWLCLYALLKGKKIFLYILIALYLGFLIPIQTLVYMNLATREAGPLNWFDEHLGWPCNYSAPLRRDLFAVAGYVALTRSLVVTLIGVVTVFVRYKNQRNNLMMVIRREGGLYLISATLLIFVNGIVMTPGIPTSPLQWVVPSLRWVFVTIFADRLLVQMRKVDDPGTQAALTTLQFHHDNKRTGSSGTSEDFGEDYENAEGIHEMREVEGAQGKSVTDGSGSADMGDGSGVELRRQGTDV